MLALVWATKYFHCYLYGKLFLDRTDHSALSYLKNVADNKIRPMGWILRIVAFDFIVEHKPGIKISHVDV